MEAIKKAIKIANVIEGWILVIILMFMTGLAFFQIVLRNFFATGFPWADVLNRHLVLWIGFLGAAVATKEGRHINIDVVSKILPAKANHAIEILVDLLSATICVVLGYAAWQFTMGERELESVLFAVSEFKVYTWVMMIVIPLGFWLIAFRFGLRSFLRAAEFVTGQTYLADTSMHGGDDAGDEGGQA